MKPSRDSIPTWALSHISQDREAKTWTCATCGIIAPFDLGHGWFGRRPCACEQPAPRTLREALLLAQLGQTYTWLGKARSESPLERHTFDTFEPVLQRKAYQQARAFASNPNGTLALYGPYGVGKTHLLAAIANALTAAHRPCLFASAATLFDAIQDRIGNDREYHTLLKRAISTPLLLLDDLDKPKPSDFRREVYYQIIDGRTKAGLPLAISANGSPLEERPAHGS